MGSPLFRLFPETGRGLSRLLPRPHRLAVHLQICREEARTSSIPKWESRLFEPLPEAGGSLSGLLNCRSEG
eukprot:13622599-Alexandrium_andersonii.AAC.1